MQEDIGLRNNKFFEVDFAIKVNVSNERRFDRSTVIFGTYTRASKNTKDRLSDVTLKNNMERSQITSRRILRF